MAVSHNIPVERLPTTPGVAAALQPGLFELRHPGLLLTRRRPQAARIVGVVGGIGAVLVGTIVGLLGIVLLFTPVRERSIVGGRVSPTTAGAGRSTRTGVAFPRSADDRRAAR